MDEKQLLQDLNLFVAEAVKLIRSNHNEMTVLSKTNRRDLVTNVDKLVERKIIQLIGERYPTAKIVSEEYHANSVDSLSGVVFFVDPIDGTMNFVQQYDHFAVMIGVYIDGEPFGGIIADVTNETNYYGSKNLGIFKNGEKMSPVLDKGIGEGLISVSSYFVLADRFSVQELIKHSLGLRILGSAGIEFTEIFDQKQIAYISHLQPWDLAAGRFIAESLGLRVTTIDGGAPSMLKSENVIISTKQLHETAMEVLHGKL